MADEGPGDSRWPNIGFSFELHLGEGRPLLFADASGLGGGAGVGASIVLKRGIFAADAAVSAWLFGQAGGTGRRDATLIHLDETASPAMRWVLKDARAAKIHGLGFAPGREKGLIEALEIACESATAEEG